ncbi:MAG: hypothetical protein ABL929_09135 [Ferruginibacter sp.]|nr:hypothetical protein [Ferruginibacter sp.]
MKNYFTIICSLLFTLQINAQQISKTDTKFLQKKEDSLKNVGLKIIQGINASDRFFADSAFTRILVRALKTKNSFYYPFDSIINVSKLYAPDSSFRIFTWQLLINENTIRQHGAIQMRTTDGSFKPFVLIDKSDVTKNAHDTIGDNLGWMGAVYYKIIVKKNDGRTFYTLLGFDENNIKSDKKVMDILEFVNGKPVFGNKLFVMEKNSTYPKNAARFIMEFKKEASAKLSYDEAMDAIVFDELVSETNTPNKKWTLIADGEYEGFKWKDGKWIHSSAIFGTKTPIKISVPKPLKDEKGNPINQEIN